MSNEEDFLPVDVQRYFCDGKDAAWETFRLGYCGGNGRGVSKPAFVPFTWRVLSYYSISERFSAKMIRTPKVRQKTFGVQFTSLTKQPFSSRPQKDILFYMTGASGAFPGRGASPSL